ncbi:hypothetical protein ADIARSV_2355 [Arcticibacter svalbardensis MN12-7]|uniref:Uncharacterized protein n=1 Tax=Arcticibacter svalbardensis MN12-7 TaxID=1150600 RepID=R9GZU3_9SPHI|nr:hypothetical protein [Arcticibacter svalbardensis]EOR94509.1 hypothetical protein ADIARSV_2355 [Arcticibacter svalbardensis MN12-7]
MIKIKYKALFALEFAHTFYKSGKCPDLVMQPSASCANLLQELGLRFLPNDFGGKLYAKVDSADIIKNPLSEGTKFTFLLKLKNRLFENITNINMIKPANSHYYFNNLIPNLAVTEPLLVANTTTKIVSDADLIPFLGNSFAFADGNTIPTETGKLEFIDSGESLEQTLNNSDNVFNFSFDLNKSTGGRARFLIDGVEKTKFYAIKSGEMSDVFGLVEIFYKSSLTSEYQFQQSNHAISTKNYKISFTNRSTKWRYIITKQFNSAINSVTVVKTNGPSIDFSLLGSSAPGKFILTSNTVLPLKEEMITGIKLTDDTDKVLIANLPNPPINLIKTEGSDTFSDILITI